MCVHGNGLILLNKPTGFTSFQALIWIKKRLGTGRVGHTGTLDKFASGIILALAGRLTKLSAFFMGLDKAYQATITFGQETETLDPYGQVTRRAPVPDLEAIRGALPGLTGIIEQIPPDYSAVHVSGKRAYQMAKVGQKPLLTPRRVMIYRLDILHYDPPHLVVEVECSKGTYIRSLARDLAAQVGSCAFVSRLQRTRIGNFSVDEAVPPEAFAPERDLLSPAAFYRRLPEIRPLTLKNPFQRAWDGSLQDRDFLHPPLKDGFYAAFDDSGQFLDFYQRQGGRYRKKS